MISAGHFHVDGKHVFMDVHNAANAIEIALDDEKFARLVVEATD